MSNLLAFRFLNTQSDTVQDGTVSWDSDQDDSKCIHVSGQPGAVKNLAERDLCQLSFFLLHGA